MRAITLSVYLLLLGWPALAAPVGETAGSVSEADFRRIRRAYFFAGGSNSGRSGDYGGTNYGLGLGLNGAAPFLTEYKLSWSVVLQADDLGKDSVGNGKRVSYYMLGLGRIVDRLQYFAHIGVADNLLMPVGGRTVTDPRTGAQYPDNVVHDSGLGFLLTMKYHVPIREVSSVQKWGWGIGPYASMGGSFEPGTYKNTYTFGASIDVQSVF